MTGFRLSPGGAQEALHIDADLVTYGKVIGAGLPVGAFAGRKEIMQHIAPLGQVYQAGTLSGNPVAMIAGYTLLGILKNNPSIYNSLNQKTASLKEKLIGVFNKKNIPIQVNQFGSMLSIHFTKEAVTDFASSSRADAGQFGRFFHHMLANGIYLPPSAFESWFLNDAISEEDINATIEAASSFE
jgi:glutamate-1-semialdehyde 2,1-aminomutase